MTITINGSGTITGASTLATTVASPTFTTPNIDSAQFATVSGTAPIYACRAWVNFNGQGTVAIRSSGNVTSITDNGAGDYTVNFTTAMPDANYSYNVSASLNYGVANFYSPALNIAKSAGTEVAPTSSACRFGFTSTTPADYDPKYVNVAIFR